MLCELIILGLMRTACLATIFKMVKGNSATCLAIQGICNGEYVGPQWRYCVKTSEICLDADGR